MWYNGISRALPSEYTIIPHSGYNTHTPYATVTDTDCWSRNISSEKLYTTVYIQHHFAKLVSDQKAGYQLQYYNCIF